VGLERFAAEWRESYVEGASKDGANHANECVFCRLGSLAVDESTGVIARGEQAFVVLNAYPYGSGHLLVVPYRHVSSLSALSDDESEELFSLIRSASRAIDQAYEPEGQNIGFNLGRAAGAGVPNHLHGHLLPRWNGDTNFMTSLGETRVLPESLGRTWQKITAVW